MSRRFDADEIDEVIAAINRKGYGLTFGLHTRIEARVQHICRRRPRRQHLRQPQPDRRGRRLAAVRRRGAVGHRAEGRRSALSAALPQVGGGRRPSCAAGAQGDLGEPHSPTICPIRRLAAGRRGPTASRCCASICAARARRRSRPRLPIDFGPVDLPGPTGEANTLTLPPRGRVLCLGPDGETLLAQAIQALAAGNAVLAVAPGAPAALQPLTGKGLPLAAIDGRPIRSNRARWASMSVAFSGEPRRPRG